MVFYAKGEFEFRKIIYTPFHCARQMLARLRNIMGALTEAE